MATSTVTPAHWKDVYEAHVGIEYKANELLRLRVGYFVSTSATAKEYAQRAMPPPGASHYVIAGVGLQPLDSLQIDVAGGGYFVESDVSATPNNAGSGVYALNAIVLALSATYGTLPSQPGFVPVFVSHFGERACEGNRTLYD